MRNNNGIVSILIMSIFSVHVYARSVTEFGNVGIEQQQMITPEALAELKLYYQSLNENINFYLALENVATNQQLNPEQKEQVRSMIQQYLSSNFFAQQRLEPIADINKQTVINISDKNIDTAVNRLTEIYRIIKESHVSDSLKNPVLMHIANIRLYLLRTK